MATAQTIPLRESEQPRAQISSRDRAVLSLSAAMCDAPPFALRAATSLLRSLTPPRTRRRSLIAFPGHEERVINGVLTDCPCLDCTRIAR